MNSWKNISHKIVKQGGISNKRCQSKSHKFFGMMYNIFWGAVFWEEQGGVAIESELRAGWWA